MSWLYSLALVAEYSEANCSDGKPFAPLNSTHTPQAFSWHDKTTEAWSLSRFGMTCEPLTGDLGADVLTWFLEDFPVKISVPQERVPESMALDLDCGWKWPGSSAKYDHDLCLWRTRQYSLLGDLDVFSEIWPRWGTMLDGESLERTPPVLPTYENESGLLPTPIDGSKGGGSSRSGKRKNETPTLQGMARKGNWPNWPGCRDIKRSGHLNPNWIEWLMGWPIGWTDIGALESDKFQQWQHLHGQF
jgi:hypothetical protein